MHLTDQDVEKYAATVESHVRAFAKRVPSHIDIEDLRGSAYVGLMEAAQAFDPERGNKFQTFASHRVKGAILDHLRALDWVPRDVRKLERTLDRAEFDATRAIGDAPEDQDVADAAGMSLEDYHAALDRTSARSIVSMDATVGEDLAMSDVVADASAASPETSTGDRLFFVRALARLNEKQKAVIEGCDLGGRTLKDVAAEIGVTESRACQLRTSAYKAMRAAA